MIKQIALCLASIALPVTLVAAYDAHQNDAGYLPLFFSFLAGALIVTIGGLFDRG